MFLKLSNTPQLALHLKTVEHRKRQAEQQLAFLETHATKTEEIEKQMQMYKSLIKSDTEEIERLS